MHVSNSPSVAMRFQNAENFAVVLPVDQLRAILNGDHFNRSASIVHFEKQGQDKFYSLREPGQHNNSGLLVNAWVIGNGRFSKNSLEPAVTRCVRPGPGEKKRVSNGI
ncbi:MAG TPA: hypothetical protein DDZ90_17420 [Planctomycetaceae bacterium]|nr:hypothetical protein [Gimesia sp.]HBL45164.1 hypothetical protein [Planctomycetaceae bacterium]